MEAGGRVSEVLGPEGTGEERGEDKRVRALERLLRVFMRSTQVDDEIVRLRLGKMLSPIFFSEVLDRLLQERVLETVPWKGRGIRDRYKLGIPMAEINAALEGGEGDFDSFIAEVRRYQAAI